MDRVVSIIISVAWLIFGLAGLMGMIMGIVADNMRIVPSFTHVLLWMICGAVLVLDKEE